jgi:hypothetical protein
MSGGWSADDAAMADLRDRLVEQGYVVLDDRYDADAFGNQVVILARPSAIRLVRDRGEWSVQVMGAGATWQGVSTPAGGPETGDLATTLEDLLARTGHLDRG